MIVHEKFELYSQQLSAAIFDAEVALRFEDDDHVASDVEYQQALARARAALRALETI